RAYKLGATAFASKPVNWRQLSYEVRYVLRASSMERELRLSEQSSRGTLQSFQQQCRDDLSAILRCVEASRAGGLAAAETWSEVGRVEVGARARLRHWDEAPREQPRRAVQSPPPASA